MFKQWLIASNTSNNHIAAEVPDEWEVGDKTGTCQYGTTNDVAIIWPDDNRAVIMAIFIPNRKNAKPNSKIVREVTKILLNRLQLNNTTKNA